MMRRQNMTRVEIIMNTHYKWIIEVKPVIDQHTVVDLFSLRSS